ncbi:MULTISPECIES: ATP-binding cassette domain-containing protein [unclassified Microbacterium]|uniref:ATP-binding cassette domain-containing protein n=1 Tax=unclassified Microbacterium TaxID=2609290 RepID=UPI0018DF5E59|nr:ATP-binding cassette domain-containing protein [Microbacterium sp. MAH-37]
MPEGQVLEFAHVTKRFGDVTALSDFSARIEPGAVTGLLGPNGAGKTTSLRILLGQVRATSGTATIGGVPYFDMRQPLRTVGSVLEETAYRPRRTAARQLQIAAKANGIPLTRVTEVLDLVGLHGDADTRIGTFSLGMRQRLSLATALLGDPGVLVLDEPANGLDPEGIRWMRLLMRRLADEGRTVLVSSHVLSEVEQVADDVVVLSKGQAVYTGGIDALSDPTTGAVIVDAEDRAPLTAALAAAGLEFDVLRSGVTVRGSDAAAIGALAAGAGVALTVLQQRGPSLEEVFLDLVYGRRTEPVLLSDLAEPVVGDSDAEELEVAAAVAAETAGNDDDSDGTDEAPAEAAEETPVDEFGAAIAAAPAFGAPGETAVAAAGAAAAVIATGDSAEAPLRDDAGDDANVDADAAQDAGAADDADAEAAPDDADADADADDAGAGGDADTDSDDAHAGGDTDADRDASADGDAAADMTQDPDAANAELSQDAGADDADVTQDAGAEAEAGADAPHDASGEADTAENAGPDTALAATAALEAEAFEPRQDAPDAAAPSTEAEGSDAAEDAAAEGATDGAAEDATSDESLDAPQDTDATEDVAPASDDAAQENAEQAGAAEAATDHSAAESAAAEAGVEPATGSEDADDRASDDEAATGAATDADADQDANAEGAAQPASGSAADHVPADTGLNDDADMLEDAEPEISSRAPISHVPLPFATSAISLPGETIEPTFTELITGLPATGAIDLGHEEEIDDAVDDAVDDVPVEAHEVFAPLLSRDIDDAPEGQPAEGAPTGAAADDDEDPRLSSMRNSLAAARRAYFEDPAPAWPYGKAPEPESSEAAEDPDEKA